MKRICLLSLIALMVACNGEKNPPSSSAAEEPETIIKKESSTNLLDKIQLVDLDNNPIDLHSFHGKTVFLNFWATWCKPCIIEMPSIERAQDQLIEENFVFLLASDEGIDRIKRFRDTRDFNLQFVRLRTPFPDLGIYSIPTTLVIDPKGKISLNQVGALEWDAPEVIEKLRSNNL